MRLYVVAFWLGIAVGRQVPFIDNAASMQVPIATDVNVGPPSTETAASMPESPNLYESIDKMISKSTQDAHETQESPNLFETIDKMIAKSSQDTHEMQYSTASERQAAIKQNREDLEPVEPVKDKPEERTGSQVDIKNKGAFLLITSDDKALKLITAKGAGSPMRQLFIKIEDILSISEKSEKKDEGDVSMTLRNGNEYLFDDLADADEVYSLLKDKMVQDTEDEG